jgi:hypothetical protein
MSTAREGPDVYPGPALAGDGVTCNGRPVDPRQRRRWRSKVGSRVTRNAALAGGRHNRSRPGRGDGQLAPSVFLARRPPRRAPSTASESHDHPSLPPSVLRSGVRSGTFTLRLLAATIGTPNSPLIGIVDELAIQHAIGLLRSCQLLTLSPARSIGPGAKPLWLRLKS